MKKHTEQALDRAMEARDDREERAVWEPPTIRAVGTIAELVQLTKRSGTQDCSGTKRTFTGNTCT
jgi:hypothetical protein